MTPNPVMQLANAGRRRGIPARRRRHTHGVSVARSTGADWYLGDAEAEQRRYPRSFFIPSRAERESLKVGDCVRLLFCLVDGGPDRPRAERMWLDVAEVGAGSYVGVLTNQPTAIDDLNVDDLVSFGPQHVISILDPRWAPYEQKRAIVSRRLLDDDDLQPGFVCHDPEDEQLPPGHDGDQCSGWQLLVGDESDAELEDASNIRLPNLAWIMERYPAFGALVFSGARDGRWLLDQASGRYRRES